MNKRFEKNPLWVENDDLWVEGTDLVPPDQLKSLIEAVKDQANMAAIRWNFDAAEISLHWDTFKVDMTTWIMEWSSFDAHGVFVDWEAEMLEMEVEALPTIEESEEIDSEEEEVIASLLAAELLQALTDDIPEDYTDDWILDDWYNLVGENVNLRDILAELDPNDEDDREKAYELVADSVIAWNKLTIEDLEDFEKLFDPEQMDALILLSWSAGQTIH